MHTVDRSIVEDAVATVGLDPDSVICDAYSGRAMFGARCLGLTVSSFSDFVHIVLELANFLGVDEMHDWELRSDNMGLGTIFYWPNVQATSVEPHPPPNTVVRVFPGSSREWRGVVVQHEKNHVVVEALDGERQTVWRDQVKRVLTCKCGLWPIEEYGEICPSCVVDDVDRELLS